jgi:cold shock CspA family protein
MRIKGKIATWNDDKGFGFITPNAGGKQVFIHISAFKNRSRRPEIDQLVTLAGGWPGALIAQQKLRHKSQKRSFRFIFWFTVLLNCSAFIWLLTPDGAITLQSFLTIMLKGLTKISS